MRILILEDHIEAQEWLSAAVIMAFGDDVKIDVVGTVATAKETLGSREFNLFLVDLHLPDGFGNEALIFAKIKYPDLQCVIATIYSDDTHLFPALRAGASGYLLKDERKEDIATMLSNIEKGIPPLSASIANRMMSHFHEPEINEEVSQLTKREMETLSFIVKGISVKECAEIMEISKHTVAGYLKDIYRKLHVSSRAEVTLEAIRLGIVAA